LITSKDGRIISGRETASKGGGGKEEFKKVDEGKPIRCVGNRSRGAVAGRGRGFIVEKGIYGLKEEEAKVGGEGQLGCRLGRG